MADDDFAPETFLDVRAVSELQTGDRVRVTWSGGNGPHEYVVHRTTYGAIQVGTPRVENVGSLYDPHRDRTTIVMIHKVQKITR